MNESSAVNDMIRFVPTNVTHFLRRLQWRWTLHRCLDAGLLAVAASAILRLAAFYLWPDSPLELLGWMICAGGAGAAAAAVFRPTFAQTVALADRELRLQDLLSSLIQPVTQSDPLFFSALALSAETAIGRHQPHEIPIAHRSAAMRIGAVLLAVIALNVAWLVQAPATTAIAAGEPAPLPIARTMANAESSIGTASTEAPRRAVNESTEASADDFTTGNAAAAATSRGRRTDAGGGASAKTNDAHADALPSIAGSFSPNGSAEAAASTLAPQADSVPSEKSASVTIPASQFGSTAAAAPAEYRDLIRAYFTPSSH